MRYKGPIYRPPSEAYSLLVQATIGCPWNKCTFCMIYKKGPKFKIRPVEEIKEDLLWAKNNYQYPINAVFFPSGNTIIMKTEDFVEILKYTKKLFPNLKRITIYGSAQYIVKKGLDDLKKIAKAGLSRIHVGLESGDDIILKKVKKGSTQEIQIKAGLLIKKVGIELSEYVVLGLGGKKRTKEHIQETIKTLNKINPDFIRIRTFLPKINTPILEEIKFGEFQILSPHEVLSETYNLIKNLKVTSQITSDHYTNYIGVNGRLPEDRKLMLQTIQKAVKKDESSFREIYIGNQ
ncbi:MAG: radical SAM protein [Thermoplasmata archaeon M9B1D]|nr:MAG: radical SAM protein [Thermoplasmata archaeon M9B1D]PNX52060.1 MAG: radical SAM protein [Thermoplasmata archaeon M8B2D]